MIQVFLGENFHDFAVGRFHETLTFLKPEAVGMADKYGSSAYSRPVHVVGCGAFVVVSS